MKPLLFKIRSARAPYTQRATSSDLFGRGMDLALAMMVFVLLGWAIDDWLGTKPLFIIVFSALAMIGGGARLKYSYDEAMRRHERDRVEATRAAARAADTQAESRR
jgi:F0F1-type ATP synthase assembly protein I